MKIKCVLLKADKMLHEQKNSPAEIVFSYFISTFIMFDKGNLIFFKTNIQVKQNRKKQISTF